MHEAWQGSSSQLWDPHLPHGGGFIIAAQILLPSHVKPLGHHVPVLFPPPLQDGFPAAGVGLQFFRCMSERLAEKLRNPERLV